MTDIAFGRLQDLPPRDRQATRRPRCLAAFNALAPEITQ
jgi:hypothetical protein